MDVPVGHLLGEAPARQCLPRATHLLSVCGTFLSPSTRRAVFCAAADFLCGGLCGLCGRALRLFRRCADSSGAAPPATDWRAMEFAAARATAAREIEIEKEREKEREKGRENEKEREREGAGEWFAAQLRLARALADGGDGEAVRKVLSRVANKTARAEKAAARAALSALAAAAEIWIECGNLNAVRGIMSADGIAPIVAARAADAMAEENAIAQNSRARFCGIEREDDTAQRFARAILSLSLARALCLLDDGDFFGFAKVFSGAGLYGADWAPPAETFAAQKHNATRAASLAGRMAPFAHATESFDSHTRARAQSESYSAIAQNSACVLPPVVGLRQTIAQRIASAPQLGAALVLAAAAALSRTAAIELFARADVAQLFRDIPAAVALVRAMEKAQFGEVVKAAETLNAAYVATDILAHKQSEALGQQLKHTVIAFFTSGFTRLRIHSAAETLGVATETLRCAVRQLAANGRLRGRVDEVEQLWIAEEEEEENALMCLQRADESMGDMEQSLRILALLRSHA